MRHHGILPGDNEQNAADAQTCQQDVHPDVRRQGVKEGEDSWISAIGFVVEDADPQSHEGLGEVDHFLPHVGDGEGGHGQVSHLRTGQGTKGVSLW